MHLCPRQFLHSFFHVHANIFDLRRWFCVLFLVFVAVCFLIAFFLDSNQHFKNRNRWYEISKYLHQFNILHFSGENIIAHVNYLYTPLLRLRACDMQTRECHYAEHFHLSEQKTIFLVNLLANVCCANFFLGGCMI